MKNSVFRFSFLALLSLLLSSLAVVHALPSPASPYHVATLEISTGQVTSVAFSPNGATLASGSNSTIHLWDVATKTNFAALSGHPWSILALSFSPDGKILASGSEVSTVKLWNLATGIDIATLAHDSNVWSVAFSPDGTILASGSWDRTIKLWGRPGNGTGTLWDILTGASITILEGHTDEIYSVAFSPDGTILASGAGRQSGTIKLWDVATGTNITTFEEPSAGVYSVAFSPDGTILASGSGWWNGLVKLRDVATGTSIATFEGHTEQVKSVAFSPDGMTLASGSMDGTIKLWDVATGTNIATFEGHSAGVYEIAFSPDGTILASGSQDGTVKLWNTSEWAPPSFQKLVKISGDEQQGPAGTQLAEPFVVLALDEHGEPIVGAVVTFAVTTGGGTLSAITATTDANGRAATTLTLGSDAGTNTVSVSVEGLESVIFTAVGEESPLASFFDAFFGGGKRVALPDNPQLAQNAPNPFNSQTVLSYFLHAPGPVRLEVFSLTGQRVAVLHQGQQQAGYHRLRWHGRDDEGQPVASGMYLYRLVTDEGVLTRKLMLLR